MTKEDSRSSATPNSQRPIPKVTCKHLGSWELGIGSLDAVSVARPRRPLRFFVTGGPAIEVDEGCQVVRCAGREATLELRVRGGGRSGAAGTPARGRRRSVGSVPVSMGRHRGLLIGTLCIGKQQKGHHPVADDGPLSILNLSLWLHHPLALRPPIRARPSSRLLSRTTTSRTTPVFAAETGSDTDNVDARDIVDGRVAEIGCACQFPGCRRAAETRRRKATKGFP